MFKELHNLCKAGNAELTMTVAMSNEKLIVSVLPRPKDKDAEFTLKPLVISGTPAELDAEFVNALRSASQATTSMVSNLTQYKKMAVQQADAKKDPVKASKPAAAVAKAAAKEKDEPGLFGDI